MKEKLQDVVFNLESFQKVNYTTMYGRAVVKTMGKAIRTLKEHQKKHFDPLAKDYNESSILASIVEQINSSCHRLSFYSMKIIDH